MATQSRGHGTLDMTKRLQTGSLRLRGDDGEDVEFPSLQ